jgi:membrane-bound metal-dependent hydrolase YbcI (DUF457 family)
MALKHQFTYGLHNAISQKRASFITTAVRTSDPSLYAFVVLVLCTFYCLRRNLSRRKFVYMVFLVLEGCCHLGCDTMWLFKNQRFGGTYHLHRQGGDTFIL